MIRVLIFISLSLFPVMAIAETVVLRSGEHADFSRIVVQFSSSVNWSFGRSDNGYELRTDALGTEFDTSEIFDLIPRTRISEVSSPGPGRLVLAVSCDCSGDVFEIRSGRLVLDIKDGAPDSSSRFEAALPSLAESEHITENPFSSAETEVGAPPAQPVLQGGIFELPVSVGEEILDTTNQRSLSFGRFTPVDGLLNISLLLFEYPVSAENTEDDDEKKLATVQFDPPREEPVPKLFPRWPSSQSGQPMADVLEPKSDRVVLAKQALLEQLGRAASQGLIDIDQPELPLLAQPMRILPDEESTDRSIHAIEVVEAAPNTSEHVRIETVIDRDRKEFALGPTLTDTGRACLAPEIFEISDWAPTDILTAPFGNLRAETILEFDEPDPLAIVELVHRFLYLGFGAEAKILLEAFDTSLPDSDILWQMAEIIDTGTVTHPGRLSSQISCSTTAAMWGMLANQKIDSGTKIDTNAVLRVFSGLPPHLRERFGPWLSENFLEADDNTSASAIRDLVERAPGERSQRFQLMEARLEASEGDIQSAVSSLEEITKSSGSSAAKAVVDLIEYKLEVGQKIDEHTALLAAALAIEHRDTDMGRKLTRAAIRGFAGSGKISETFERIEQAQSSGDISTREAEDLRTESHLRNAQFASNVEFLTVVFRYEDVLGKSSELSHLTHQKIGARLVSLGLPGKALALYSAAEFKLEAEDNIILAEANLLLGDHAGTVQNLHGLVDDASQLLVARANEMQQDYGAAARIFAALEMDSEYQSAVWRAGEWQAVAAGNSEIRTNAANLVLETEGSKAENSAGTDGPPIEAPVTDSRVATIAENKSLLAQSEATRQTIQDLLKPEITQ